MPATSLPFGRTQTKSIITTLVSIYGSIASDPKFSTHHQVHYNEATRIPTGEKESTYLYIFKVSMTLPACKLSSLGFSY